MSLQTSWRNVQLEAQAYAHVAMEGMRSIPGRLDRAVAHRRIPDLEEELEALKYARGDTALSLGQDEDQEVLRIKIARKSDVLSGFKAKIPDDYVPVGQIVREGLSAVVNARQVVADMIIQERREMQLEALKMLGQGRSPDDTGVMG